MVDCLAQQTNFRLRSEEDSCEVEFPILVVKDLISHDESKDFLVYMIRSNRIFITQKNYYLAH